MHYFPCLFGLVFLFNSLVQTEVVFSQMKTSTQHDYYVEHLSYQADVSGHSFEEIFIRVPVSNFVFGEASGGYMCKYRVSVRLAHNESARTVHLSYSDSATIASFREINDLQPHLVRFSFVIPPGNYAANFCIVDENAATEQAFTQELEVEDFRARKLSVSDLKFFREERPLDAKDPRQSEHWQAVSNILGLFAAGEKYLNVLAEVYHLSEDASSGESEYRVSFLIQTRRGQKLRYLEKVVRGTGSTNVLQSQIPIDDLPVGFYRFVLRIKDLRTGQTARKHKFFEIINPLYM